MRKALLVLAAATLAVSVLAVSACSSSPSPTPTQTTAPAPKPTTSAPQPSTSTAPSPSATQTAPGPTYTLKIGSSLAVTSSNIQGGVAWWMDEVTKRTNGSVKFQPFWGGTLVQQGEELNATQKGVLDAGVIVSTYFPNEMPLFGWDYAFMFSPTDPAMAAKLAAKVMERPEVRNNIEQYNLKIISPIVLGPYSYNGIKIFKTIDDLKGVKVAVIGTQMPRWVQAAGGVPVTMGAADRYMALQTGVVGGSLLSTDAIFNFKLSEVGKFVTTTELGAPIGNALCLNKDSFNRLPADLQKILVDTGNEIGVFNTQYVTTAYTSALQKMKDSGATITPFSYEEKVKWANAVPNLPAEWAKQMDAKGLPGTTLVNFYLQAAKDLGYKWPREWTAQ